MPGILLFFMHGSAQGQYVAKAPARGSVRHDVSKRVISSGMREKPARLAWEWKRSARFVMQWPDQRKQVAEETSGGRGKRKLLRSTAQMHG